MIQKIAFTDNPSGVLTEMVADLKPDHIFILTDSNTARHCLPLISSFREQFPTIDITIPAGEANKNLSTLSSVWETLCRKGGSRKSLLINLGGGVVTDLGGFAAATFKRGISFLNFPTTMLAAADAAVGGKTGIDFLDLKNEIGAFAPADGVVISTLPFSTLPQPEFLSGFAEMVKMAMIANPDLYGNILRDLDAADYHLSHDAPIVNSALRFAVEEKQRIVTEDPREQGIRAWLNFGHSAGHAFEALLLARYEKSLNRQGGADSGDNAVATPVSHGCAVAHGILVALILGHMILKAPSQLIYTYRDSILRPLYGRLPLGCGDVDVLIDLMRHDKKNADGNFRLILLREIGTPEIIIVPEADIRAALDIFIDLQN